MGLSNYPTPTDGGMFIIILLNAALSICVVKDIFISMLQVVGIHIASAEEPSIESPTNRGIPLETYMEEGTRTASAEEPSIENPLETYMEEGVQISSAEEPSIESSVEAYMEEFRSRIPTRRFDTVIRPKQGECSVCLTEFVPEAAVNYLPCGHVFHKLCLENWLKSWRITCPNCRTFVMPPEEDSCLLAMLQRGNAENAENAG